MEQDELHTSSGMGAIIIVKCTLFLLYLREVASEAFGTGCLCGAIAATFVVKKFRPKCNIYLFEWHIEFPSIWITWFMPVMQ